MKSYGRLAAVYDILMDHVDFHKTTRFYLDTAGRFAWTGRRILDLACGTGNVTIELLKAGYDVYGLDSSQEMLAVADQKIYQAGFTPQLVCQDMRKIDMPQKFDLILCAFDSLNYLPKEADLEKTFAGIRRLMHENSFFLFDVHTEYKFKELLGENTFTYLSDEVCYIWENHFNEKKKTCDMKLNIFLKRANQCYERFKEEHQERYYSPELLEKHLLGNGLEILGIFGDWKHVRPKAKTQRLIFATRLNR